MARIESLVHIEDRQMSELKKVINQSDLKKIHEMDKLSKQLSDINKKLNIVVSGLDLLFRTLSGYISEEESDG